ncbi:DeoR family transcriptional regulator [Haloterrigena sp. SYSU A558-1]|uniref:DeoR family transcriptional regulator n=1 Tax=Haloterrigena gelatinilytica TaxID=2741724 RepID=A0ABX2LIP8_9EURY|nr:DeoR family transcriptional regulator [Haloterrigena gelatinilytica]NUC74753.1 DeoR family transcriptional regulator [Haloterrigena gelatinilytica]
MSRKTRIKRVLERADKPLSTNEVAARASVAWHTARDDLEELHDEGAAYRTELNNRLTMWWDCEIPL